MGKFLKTIISIMEILLESIEEKIKKNILQKVKDLSLSPIVQSI